MGYFQKKSAGFYILAESMLMLSPKEDEHKVIKILFDYSSETIGVNIHLIIVNLFERNE